eukprot:TRINITY_DN106657_c0_g2_i2.p1 TRINITY_DN106657_c0_g2~~TRINITY_DN106657_c0_g2_i2.p1  ORF type:complete len:593 (+),score=107.09 TRINITY_DN106657_c0_g2_i2:670-2448(+)
MARLADYVISTLYENAVKHLFLVTGRGALFLTDAVAAHKEIKSISMHHEQSAGFAAVAYAQANNKLGACLVSTGCASTNTITAVLNAWQDGIPCVFISGQNKLNETTYYTEMPIRTYGQQEANIIPLVESITKYAVMITDPSTIAYELEKAIHLATTGRKGPVWIDIPLDVQNMRVDSDKIEHFLPSIEEKSIKNREIEYLQKEFNAAKRPVVLIGSGVSTANAEKELKNFVESNQIPLVYSPSASDIYGLNNDLSIGSVGIMGCTRSGNFAVQNSDLVLVLGSRLNSMLVGEKCQFARDAKVIVVDIDEVEHSKGSVNIDKLIVSDVKIVLEQLITKNIKRTDSNWVDKCKHWKKVFPICEESFRSEDKVDLYELAESLSKVLPEKTNIITDSGLIELIIPSNLSLSSGQKCIHPISQGSMGFALAGAVGAYYSNLNPTIVIVGDGSIMMNIQELITISYNKIPAKVFVVNNNAYAVIRKRQKELFRNRTIGNDPSDGVGVPEFEKLADTFNFKYSKIETNQNLEKKLADVLSLEGPVLCEIMGLEDQGFIGSGHAKDLNGRIVTRPIEDQRPYLDRELFLSEMIIDPIHQ